MVVIFISRYQDHNVGGFFSSEFRPKMLVLMFELSFSPMGFKWNIQFTR